MVSTEIRGIVQKYLSVLAQNGIPVQRAFVYGSYARNEATSASDIDVMLVSDFFDTADVFKRAKTWRFAADIDHRIEPVGVSEKRFLSDEGSPLIAAVKEEGVEIAA